MTKPALIALGTTVVILAWSGVAAQNHPGPGSPLSTPEPYQHALTDSVPFDLSYFAVEFPAVPAGKRLTIQFVSVTSPGASARCRLFAGDPGAIDNLPGSIPHDMVHDVAMLSRSEAASAPAYVTASTPITMYVEAGKAPAVFCRFDSVEYYGATGWAQITGQLTNVP
jgi:hypothetical protein